MSPEEQGLSGNGGWCGYANEERGLDRGQGFLQGRDMGSERKEGAQDRCRGMSGEEGSLKGVGTLRGWRNH